MKDSLLISITLVLIYIFFFVNRSNLKLIETNGEKVLVQDQRNSKNNAMLLSKLIKNMYKLRDNVVKNVDYFPKYRKYILLLKNNFNRSRTKIYENSINSKYTSYCVNKGEEFVFCLTCKHTKKLHTINLITYVAVHEIAHAACPEIGHTPLFNDIFRFLLKESIKLNIYYYENYSQNPVYYCGMKLYSNILN